MERPRTKILSLFFIGIIFLWSEVAFSGLNSPGIKVGSKGVFHPRLYINSGFDSNVFHRSPQSKLTSKKYQHMKDIKGSIYLGIRPGLQLDIPSDSVEFYLSGLVNYTFFFNAMNLNNLTAKADLSLTFLPKSKVSFMISNNFTRGSGDTFSADDIFDAILYYYTPGTQTGAPYISHNNESTLIISIKPGSGVLQFDIGTALAFGLYPSEDLDYFAPKFMLNAKWNFFPRTAFFFMGDFQIFNFAPRLNFSREGLNVDTYPLHLYIGMAGQLTEKMLLSIRVGGGYTFAADRSKSNPPLPKDDYGMVIGSVDLTYAFGLATFLKAGFKHDFYPSFFGNYYTITGGYAQFSAQFGPVVRPFVFNIQANLNYQYYGKVPLRLGESLFNVAEKNKDGTFNRKDFVVTGRVDLQWYPFKYWMIGLTGRLQFRNSNTFVVLTAQDQLGFGYFKAEVFLQTEIAY